MNMDIYLDQVDEALWYLERNEKFMDGVKILRDKYGISPLIKVEDIEAWKLEKWDARTQKSFLQDLADFLVEGKSNRVLMITSHYIEAYVFSNEFAFREQVLPFRREILSRRINGNVLELKMYIDRDSDLEELTERLRKDWSNIKQARRKIVEIKYKPSDAFGDKLAIWKAYADTGYSLNGLMEMAKDKLFKGNRYEDSLYNEHILKSFLESTNKLINRQMESVF
jgi:hypothetical protein